LKKVVGWLFDLYAHPTKGVVLWLVGEDGKPYNFYQDFETVFYARGSDSRLHDLGLFLRKKYPKENVRLTRDEKEDLFDGPQVVMGIGISNFALYNKLFREVQDSFSDLIFYDADIPLTVRYAAANDVFMMARCEVVAEDDGRIVSIKALEKPVDIDPQLPNLRILSLRPDTDPSHKPPKFLIAKYGKFYLRLPFAQPQELISLLNGILLGYNPDVIQTHYGDGYLLSKLLELSQKTGIPLNLNRDLSVPVLRKKAVDFFNYGRAHYRAPQIHLRGRWHVDVENGMTYNQYHLVGAMEHSRLSCLPLQEVARRSPGAAMAAMINLTALKRKTLVPYQRQKGEIAKTFSEFVRGDRGGLVLQPLPGIFPNVAILDFASMMPSIMIKYNVSPEKVVAIDDEREGFEIRDLGVKVLQATPGLIPQTLKPMRDKRLALKQLLKSTNKNDPRYRALSERYKVLTNATDRKAVTDALKWLGVVCYGRLGFAMATFGRLNAHEVVSYLSRKNVMRARSIAASMGFETKHVYVDSVFLCKEGATAEDFQALADKIAEQTGLPMDFDGTIYRWFAFLATRENPNIAVANRFYGLSPDGNHKIRGIALRRGDTPKFVANIQQSVLETLAKEADPAKLPNRLPEILEMVQGQLDSLKKREVPLEQLVVTLTLSKELINYSVLSAPVVAARQLAVQGKTLRRGQRIRFIHTAKAPGAHAWDLPTALDPRGINVFKYRELAFLSAYEVLQPLGITERVLKDWIFNKASYVMPEDLTNPSQQLAKQEVPIFADLPYLHLDVI
jgi:DNA polymerase II